MIRSFSGGTNFPTSYSHFAGEDIKYHFMFQFLVGNLEFLGMRLDFAFNIPSLLGMVSTFLLLYVFAVKLTGKRPVGYLAGIFFAFRSSFGVFRYLAERPRGKGVWEAFTEHSEFIGYTPNEDWGLWNLNVYCNQRHLAFSLGVLLLVLILFTPYLYAMGKLFPPRATSFFAAAASAILVIRWSSASSPPSTPSFSSSTTLSFCSP